MSDLLKRADNLNALNDGISGHNQIVVDLVDELAARVRDLESRSQFAIDWLENGKVGDAPISWDAEMLVKHLLREETSEPIIRNKEYAKKIATGFFRYWWNMEGSNTDQGFDQYWRELRQIELGIIEEDVAETKFPPALEPFDITNADPEYAREWNQRFEQISRTAPTGKLPEKIRKTFAELRELTKKAVPTVTHEVPEAVPVITKHRQREYKTVTLENLQKDWLLGTTCHNKTRTVHWVSDDGQWIVMKHQGHSEWVGGWNGNSYCGTYYAMFRVGDEFPDRMGRSPYFTQESRWSKASMEWVEKVIAGWRPDNLVETQ